MIKLIWSDLSHNLSIRRQEKQIKHLAQIMGHLPCLWREYSVRITWVAMGRNVKGIHGRNLEGF